jgi:hypothetical protein
MAIRPTSRARTQEAHLPHGRDLDDRSWRLATEDIGDVVERKTAGKPSDRLV